MAVEEVIGKLQGELAQAREDLERALRVSDSIALTLDRVSEEKAELLDALKDLLDAIAAHGSGATNKERRRNREELIDAAYTGGSYAIAKAEEKP